MEFHGAAWRYITSNTASLEGATLFAALIGAVRATDSNMYADIRGLVQ